MRTFKATAVLDAAALLLSACEGTQQTKEETAAAVEERSAQTSTASSQVNTGAQAQAIPGSGASAPGALDDPNSLLSQRVVYFEFDSAEVRDEDLSIIEAHARYLLNTPSAGILLEGHADERGAREYNVALGERRALSVTQIMQLLGVPSSQIRTVSYGEERPAVDGSNEVSWQQNRRVELVY